MTFSRRFLMLAPLAVALSACVLPDFENGPVPADAAAGGQAGNGGSPQEAATDEAGDDVSPDVVETGECNPGDEQELGPCDMCGVLLRTCTAAGVWSDAACLAQGECEQGETKQEACGTCGTITHTCNDACEWESGACESTGVCTPGEIRDCMCSTNFGNTVCCGAEVCNANCTWDPCALAQGNTCDWNGGHEYRCCGAGKWEYCLSTCQWSGQCESCSDCSC